MKTEIPIEKKIIAAVKKYGLFTQKSKILVGFSGGSDSLCLIYALNRISKSGEYPAELHLCHINHRLRPDSNKDEEFCRSVAEKLQMPITVKQLNFNSNRGGIEEKARILRYETLHSVANEIDASSIAVGHTLDDQAETVLMRLLRGAGVRGLAGILPARRIFPQTEIKVVRPLIEITRKEITEYLESNQLNWIEDSTNTDTTLLRNKIRHNVLPYLEKLSGRDMRNHLARIAEVSFEMRPLLDIRARELIGSLILSQGRGEIQLELEPLRELCRLDIFLFLEEILKRFNTKITKAAVERFIALLNSSSTSSKAPLCSGVEAFMEYDKVIIAGVESRNIHVEETILNLQGKVEVSVLGISFSCKCVKKGDFNLKEFMSKKTAMEEAFDISAVQGKLFVRLPHAGERFTPLGVEGSNKISDFLIDKKVPKRLRNKISVVCDNNSVIWLVGYRLDNKVKIRDNTKKIVIIRTHLLENN
ncbi:MAG: tRNA lysidine(34) synthetase TilS [Planctomycetota bacterium]